MSDTRVAETPQPTAPSPASPKPEMWLSQAANLLNLYECGYLTYYLMDDASRDVREKWNRRSIQQSDTETPLQSTPQIEVDRPEVARIATPERVPELPLLPDDDELVRIALEVFPDDPGFLRTKWKDGIDIQVPTVKYCELSLRLTKTVRDQLRAALATIERMEEEYGRLQRTVAFMEETYLEQHGGSWGVCKYQSELARLSSPKASGDEWIDVNQELPKQKTQCLIWSRGGRPGLAEIQEDGYWWGTVAHDNISHWRPLPAPPTGKEGKK